MLNGEMSSTFIMNSIKYQLMGKMMDKMMDKESELTKDVRDLVRFIGMKSIDDSNINCPETKWFNNFCFVNAY